MTSRSISLPLSSRTKKNQRGVCVWLHIFPILPDYYRLDTGQYFELALIIHNVHIESPFLGQRGECRFSLSYWTHLWTWTRPQNTRGSICCCCFSRLLPMRCLETTHTYSLRACTQDVQMSLKGLIPSCWEGWFLGSRRDSVPCQLQQLQHASAPSSVTSALLPLSHSLLPSLVFLPPSCEDH